MFYKCLKIRHEFIKCLLHAVVKHRNKAKDEQRYILSVCWEIYLIRDLNLKK